MKTLLITNNDKVLESFQDKSVIVYLSKASYLEVLYETRNLVHKGHKLLSHPMAGSLKPNQTPYRTVVLENKESSMEQCVDSIMLIESAIDAAKKFLNDKDTPLWKEQVKEDFKTVDLSFLQGSIEKFL